MTRKEFLDDMVAFYSAEPARRRSFNSTGGCAYRGKNGTKCAIGRHIPDEAYRTSLEGDWITSSIVREALPDAIIELGIDFLDRVQALHDTEEFWGSVVGLTEEGKRWVHHIEQDFIS